MRVETPVFLSPPIPGTERGGGEADHQCLENQRCRDADASASTRMSGLGT